MLGTVPGTGSGTGATRTYIGLVLVPVMVLGLPIPVLLLVLALVHRYLAILVYWEVLGLLVPTCIEAHTHMSSTSNQVLPGTT